VTGLHAILGGGRRGRDLVRERGADERGDAMVLWCLLLALMLLPLGGLSIDGLGRRSCQGGGTPVSGDGGWWEVAQQWPVGVRWCPAPALGDVALCVSGGGRAWSSGRGICVWVSRTSQLAPRGPTPAGVLTRENGSGGRTGAFPGTLHPQLGRATL
jgi:hypothetical protein